MQDLGFVTHFWYHIEVPDITWQSGDMPISGMQWLCIYCNYLIIDPHNSPANKEELFNLRHAQKRNVVERIFGVVKKRWGILTRPPQFTMDIQAKIPSALAALHNFIMQHNSQDCLHYVSNMEDDLDPNPGVVQQNPHGVLSTQAVNQAEKTQATAYHEHIAQEMWDEYLTHHQPGDLND
jgi:hypothetical protein